MLYRHEKICFQIKQTSVEPSLAIATLHIQCSLLRWFVCTIQMNSRLCPWLLTWSDYKEDAEEDDGGNNDAGAERAFPA
jgi:hypothetical protein